MSTTTLRHHLNTLAFLPRQRDKRIVKGLRALKIRTSRRRFKQVIRQLIDHRTLSVPVYA
ncbi:MAG TPA: hypothetical protein VJB64_01555 [Patescibacteria group bacterium]|nr:hypothetical protein [Patescibacteria group bacterium]